MISAPEIEPQEALYVTPDRGFRIFTAPKVSLKGSKSASCRSEASPGGGPSCSQSQCTFPHVRAKRFGWK